jgi:ADP-ribose pyrophosphatase YjhB (NUDIX family)
MPRKISAGCLVRATFDGDVCHLIVHPSGRYNRHRPYPIPKGLVEPGELPEKAALRETREETGLDCRILAPLGEIDYVKSRSRRPPRRRSSPPIGRSIARSFCRPIRRARGSIRTSVRSSIVRWRGKAAQVAGD